jgi:hypothetical protein
MYANKPVECYMQYPLNDELHTLAASALYALPGLWHVVPDP